MKKVLAITLFLSCVFGVSAQSNVAHLNSQEVIDVLATNNLLELKIEEYEDQLYEPLIDLCEKAILLVAERNNYDGVYDVKLLLIHKTVQTSRKKSLFRM